MFYQEQAKYMRMFDMINKLMSCHMMSFMRGPQQLDRTGEISNFIAVFYCGIAVYTVSQKNRTLVTFSNISNKSGPILIIFGNENRQ